MVLRLKCDASFKIFKVEGSGLDGGESAQIRSLNVLECGWMKPEELSGPGCIEFRSCLRPQP